jgi:hypothetical protein
MIIRVYWGSGTVFEPRERGQLYVSSSYCVVSYRIVSYRQSHDSDGRGLMSGTCRFGIAVLREGLSIVFRINPKSCVLGCLHIDEMSEDRWERRHEVDRWTEIKDSSDSAN